MAKKAPNMTLLAKDGIPYMRDMESWYTQYKGLRIHRIPEEPDVYTVSTEAGLRLGAGRFGSVHDAEVCLSECFSTRIDFTNPRIQSDLSFGLGFQAWMQKCVQVPKNMSNVVSRTFEVDVIHG